MPEWIGQRAIECASCENIIVGRETNAGTVAPATEGGLCPACGASEFSVLE